MVVSGQLIEFAARIIFQQEAKCGRKEDGQSIQTRGQALDIPFPQTPFERLDLRHMMPGFYTRNPN